MSRYPVIDCSVQASSYGAYKIDTEIRGPAAFRGNLKLVPGAIDFHWVEMPPYPTAMVNSRDWISSLIESDAFVLPDVALNFFLENQEAIPREWSVSGKSILFFGSIYKKGDEHYVRCLKFLDNKWKKDIVMMTFFSKAFVAAKLSQEYVKKFGLI